MRDMDREGGKGPCETCRGDTESWLIWIPGDGVYGEEERFRICRPCFVWLQGRVDEAQRDAGRCPAVAPICGDEGRLFRCAMPRRHGHHHRATAGREDGLTFTWTEKVEEET